MDNKYELYHVGVKGMKWGVRRYQNKDGSLTNAGKRRYNDIHDDYRKAHSGKNVKFMSNAELKEINKRLEAENNYKRLTKKTNVGEKAVKTFISAAGTIAAATAAYGTYKKLADQGINKIGDWIIKGINLSGPLH